MSTTPASRTFTPSAEVYEQHLVRLLFQPWAEELLKVATPRPGDRVLDVACGTGAVARTAAPRVGPAGAVSGLDVNPQMLDVAARACAGTHPPITWVCGGADTMPLPDDAFDVTYCQQGVQFFPDRLAGLSEMRRVTTPDGQVALSIWRGFDHHPVMPAFDDALAAYVDQDEVGDSSAPFSLGDLDEVRSLLDAAAFHEVEIRQMSRPVRYDSAAQMLAAVGGAFAPLAEAVADLDADSKESLLAELATALTPWTVDGAVTFDMQTSVVLARP
jgi:SAM-dependent methyltransferase